MEGRGAEQQEEQGRRGQRAAERDANQAEPSTPPPYPRNGQNDGPNHDDWQENNRGKQRAPQQEHLSGGSGARR